MDEFTTSEIAGAVAFVILGLGGIIWTARKEHISKIDNNVEGVTKQFTEDIKELDRRVAVEMRDMDNRISDKFMEVSKTVICERKEIELKLERYNKENTDIRHRKETGIAEAIGEAQLIAFKAEEKVGVLEYRVDNQDKIIAEGLRRISRKMDRNDDT